MDDVEVSAGILDVISEKGSSTEKSLKNIFKFLGRNPGVSEKNLKKHKEKTFAFISERIFVEKKIQN